MKYVIDKNMFGDERLGHYLSESSNNIAIITEYAMMETYSSATRDNFSNDLRILKYFPNQVVIMVGNSALRQLGYEKRRQLELIDNAATENFQGVLMGLRFGGVINENQLSKNKELAQSNLAKIKNNIARTRHVIEALGPEIRKSCVGKEGDLPKFGKRGLEKIKIHAATIARTLYKMSAGMDISDALLVQTFEFRHAISITASIVIRSTNGKFQDLSQETVKTDVIDCNYIACSTYWDGYLTGDDIANKTHRFLRDTIKIFG